MVKFFLVLPKCVSTEFFLLPGGQIGLAVPNLLNTGMLKVDTITITIINLAALWVDKCPQGRAAFKRRAGVGRNKMLGTIVDYGPFSIMRQFIVLIFSMTNATSLHILVL